MNLQGKTIILTGARRIGQTVAEELAKKGANLAITYRSAKEESEAVCTACMAMGVKAEPFMADLSKEEDIKKVVAQIKTKFGRIDGLVHMAAPYPKTPFGNITMDQCDEIMRSIAGSATILGQAVGKELLKNSGEVKGKIIFFTDWSVLRMPFEDYIVYNQAKAAVVSLTKTLARELSPGVTVNSIAPGPILRPPDLTEQEDKSTLQRTLLKRWGGAESIAQAVIFLLEDDFITGVDLPVDGGRSIA